MWLTNLKIAIVEKNIEKFSELMDEIPQLQTQAEMEEALYLIREASNLVHTLKDETLSSMKQIKNNLNYIKSTQNKSKSKFDIKSY